MSIPGTRPKILWGSSYQNTLWLPQNILANSWDVKWTKQPVMTQGSAYVQIVNTGSFTRCEVKGKTRQFANSTENWNGSSAQTFKVAWDNCWNLWLSQGLPFRFYRCASDASAGESYFTFCVWTLDGRGLYRYPLGIERYGLEIEFVTELGPR